MIKTTIVFDYGTEEFTVTLYDQHLDPNALLVQHRGTYNHASKELTNLSYNRIEVRHEGRPDELTLDNDGPFDEDLEDELDALAEMADRGQLSQAEIDEWVYGRGLI